MCDLVNCDRPEVPHCEDGQTVILKNPGECQPVHECGTTFKMFSPLYFCYAHTGKHREGEPVQTWSCLHSFFLHQSARKKSVPVRLSLIVLHIASCQGKGQSAAMSLNVCATVRTSPNPALLVSSQPPIPMTVAAQKHHVCQTKWV